MPRLTELEQNLVNVLREAKSVRVKFIDEEPEVADPEKWAEIRRAV